MFISRSGEPGNEASIPRLAQSCTSKNNHFVDTPTLPTSTFKIDKVGVDKVGINPNT